MKLLRCLSILVLLGINFTFLYAQDRVITGKITDKNTGLPLSGVSILVEKNKGIVSKADGSYSVRVNSSVSKLIFSYVGYTTQSISIGDKKVIDVALEPAAVEQSEVVVIGYGTRKKSNVTGAVSKVTTDEIIGEIPVSRADDALKGKLAGVNISTTDAQAGAAPTIQIRGATSVTAGTSPLIVIDGYPVPTDLSAIDMNDVESIEVLKDAASAAIYGSRGGNGVILITTKSGKAGTRKISVNASTGLKNVYKKLNFGDLQSWKAYVAADNNGVIPAEITQAEAFDGKTDVQDYIFRQVRFTNLQLAASGGTNTFKYYLSGNGLIDNGILLGNDYKRFGLKASFNAKVSDRTTIDFSFTPSYTQFFDVPVTLQEAIRALSPWMPLYHTAATSAATGMPIGSYTHQRDFQVSYNPNYTGVNIGQGSSNNPLEQQEGITDKTTNIRALTNFSVKIELAKNLSFKSSVGLLVGESTREYFQKSWAQAQTLIDGDINARASTLSILNKTRTLDISNENIFTYKKVISKHDFDFVAGFTNQYTNTSYLSGQAGNFSTDEIPTLNAGVTKSLTSNIQEEALTSFLGRVSYAYDSKYLLSVSQRADGSSRFGPDNRWAFFPSISGGWNITREKFFTNQKYVNEIKLRASYGATGNKNIGNYRYQPTVSPDYVVLGSEPIPATQLTTFGNPTLKWERTYSANFGIDFGFFRDKLRLSVNYYNTKTDRLLLNLPILSSSGFAQYYINNGKVQNKGFEVEISAPILNKKNFKWSISANGYTNKNTLLDFGGTDYQINQGDPKRANFFLTQIGQPLVQYYGYQATTPVIIKNTPNYPTNYWPIGVTALHTFVKDQNGDGIIDDNDRVVLGTPYPKFNWGLTNSFRYKSFDFNFTLQGSHGAKVFNIDPYYFETQSTRTGNSAYKNPDLYTVDQQNSVRQKPQTDLNIQDASFVAVRNLNIGYGFSNKAIKKLGLTKMRLYASSANLWYHFASNYTSYNPEADNGFPNDPLRKGYQRGAAPLARTITFGINVDF